MRTFKKVLSVALVLAMAVSCFALTSLAKSTPGTITVDGKLDDNGWAADGWTTVDTTTGTFQGVGGKDTYKYDFQLAADATNLYIAIKSPVAPAWVETPKSGSDTEIDYQTSATNLRLWLDSNADGTRDYLIDFGHKDDFSTLISRADNLTEEQIASIQYKNAKADDSYSIEIAIPLTTVGITGDFKYILSLSAPNAGTKEVAVEGGEEGEETEQVITGYTVTYLLNGQQSTVTLDAEASVSRGGAAFTFENGRVTGTTSLRRVAATQINGLTASTASGALSIADNAAVYVKIGSDYYQSTLATISGSSDYELTCYADRSSGGKVRVIVAEQK